MFGTQRGPGFGGTVLVWRDVRNGQPPALSPHTRGKNLEGRPHNWNLAPWSIMFRTHPGVQVPVASWRQYFLKVVFRILLDYFCPKVLPFARPIVNT